MAIKLADAFVPITGDDSPLRRTLGGTKRFLGNFLRDIGQGISQGFGQAIFNSIGRAIGSGVNLVKQSLNATRDLTESLSKTTVAFGDSSKMILDWSKNSATALGQSRGQALEAAASFGLLFSSMGLATDQSAEMSMALVELATDMASINNIGIDEALIKLRAGLVGETEPLRTVGVLLNAVAVEQEALRMGLASTKDAITEQDKVMARYALILRQTAKTQGDFARTSDQIANQERQLAAQRQDALAQIGSAFAPIYLVILRSINRVMGEIAPYGENIVRTLATGIVNGIIYILPALRAVRDVITYWLKPGSPPRILPDLARWAKDTMQTYLDSYADADFGVIQQLGSTIENILRSFVTSGAIGEGDIVSRVFGTRRAIAQAVAQWRNAGQVTEDSIRAIQDAAGPAGFSLAGLVRSYFDLEGASRRAAAAQRELADVTERYDAILAPLNAALDEINDKQQEIRDKQSISAARKTLRDPAATANEKRLAQLDIEEIKLRQQIDTREEERDAALEAANAKLKAAQREEQVAKAVFDAQSALLDLQMTTNRLIGEENDLRKKQAEDAERVYQAALQYNLALADTEGKIALLRLELTRYKEGSVEHYGILTQIAGLQESIKAEADTGSLIPPGGVLPSLEELGIPQWAEELADRLETEINKFLGLKPPVLGVLLEVPEAPEFTSMLDRLRPEDPGQSISGEIKDFVESLKELTGAIQGVTPALQTFASFFETTPKTVDKGGEEVATSTKTWLEKAAASFRFWTMVMEGDWQGLWDNYVIAAREDQKTTAEDHVVWLAGLVQTFDNWHDNEWNAAIVRFFTVTLGEWVIGLRSWGAEVDAWFLLKLGEFETWLGDVQQTIIDWDLAEAGKTLVSSLWTGMSTYWTETVQPWWQKKMQWLSDLLPGSEPKDPSSPLAGLKDRGKAIVENLQIGIDSMDLSLPSGTGRTLEAGVAAAGAGGGGRSLVIEAGAFQFYGVAGAEQAVDSFEKALDKLLEEMANA